MLELISAKPTAGFNYPYYLITPGTTADDPMPLLVEPNNTGTATDDFEQHQQAAKETAEHGVGRSIADELTAPLLVPVFPRPQSDPVDSTHYVHALDDTTMKIRNGPLERVDRQLLSMVDDARQRLADKEYSVRDDGIILNGFSASGNFVERFATIHPNEVISVTAGGINGMPILPVDSTAGRQSKRHQLSYPVGIANVEELTGTKFDADAFSDVNRFLYQGEFDGNDTIPYNDAWTDDELRQTALDVYGKHMRDDRLPYARAVYDEIGAPAVFRVYKKRMHQPAPVSDLVEFHKRSLSGDDIDSLRASLGGGVPNRRAAINYNPEQAVIGEQVAFHGNTTKIRNADAVEYDWELPDGTTKKGKMITHVFNSNGTHPVHLTVTDDTGKTHHATEYIEITDLTTIRINVSPATASVGDDIKFEVSDDTEVAGTKIVGYQWDFGTQSVATGQSTTYAYEKEGVFTVTLTVTTKRGDVYQQTTEVEIEDVGKTVADYADPDTGIVEADGLAEAFADWQAGDIEAGLLGEVFAAWQSGEPVE